MVAINKNETQELGDIYSKIMNLEREDYATPSKKSTLYQHSKGFGINLRNEGDFKKFRFTDHARTQFNDRWTGFNTFSKTLDKLGHNGLYMRTANDLLEEDSRQMVIRTIAGEGDFQPRIARAVVSDAFKPIDDNLLVPEMLNVAGDSDEFRSLGGQLTDTNTFIRFISRTPQIQLNVDGRQRDLHIGFQYSNSEVGRGYAKFSAFFFDSFCENGCVFDQLTVADVKYAHRGSRISTQCGRIFENRIREQEMLSIQATIVEATQLAIQGTYIPEVKQLLERSLSKEIPTDADTAKFVQEVGKRVGLSQAEQEHALMHYGGEGTMYGVQAAITRLAQDANTFARRAELEQAGGNVLGMTDKVWNSIAALAA